MSNALLEVLGLLSLLYTVLGQTQGICHPQCTGSANQSSQDSSPPTFPWVNVT